MTGTDSPMDARFQSPVGDAWYDWNKKQNEDGTIRLIFSHGFYHGIIPTVGDVVRVVDPDASCGVCEAVIRQIREGNAYSPDYLGADAEVISPIRYWCQMDRPVTTGSGPDWLMRTYDAMRGGPDWIGELP